MSNDWLCQIGDQTHGPMPHADLARMAASGQLRPTDQVKKPEWSRWIQASFVVGLTFPSSSAAKPAAPPPSIVKSPPPLSTVAPNGPPAADDVQGKKPADFEKLPSAATVRSEPPPLPLPPKSRPAPISPPNNAARAPASQARSDAFSCFCPECKATLSAPKSDASEISCWNCGSQWNLNSLINRSTALLRQYEAAQPVAGQKDSSATVSSINSISELPTTTTANDSAPAACEDEVHHDQAVNKSADSPLAGYTVDSIPPPPGASSIKKAE